MIPFVNLKPQYEALKKNIDQAIHDVLDHGLFILGPEIQECERLLSEHTGSPYSLAVASGTDALVMALMALDLQPGDEVITTAFSFFATAEAVALLGGVPVFVDIEPDTYNMRADQIEALITSRTKAIIPVSLYGQPADMDEINRVAEKHGVTVIEDAAQSFGATYKGKTSCNLSTIGCTSFFPAKPLGCYGDGGAVFTNNEDLYKKMESIRTHGQEGRYHHTRMGINGRMDSIQCAVINQKMPRYNWEIEQRQRIAETYSRELAGLAPKVITPQVRTDRTSVWAQYTVRVNERESFQAFLKEKGVPTSIHYPSGLHEQPALKGKCKTPVALSETERAGREVISLPLYADMPAQDVQLVIESVRAFSAR